MTIKDKLVTKIGLKEPSSKLLRQSAFMTLIALGLMVWSMLQPTPMPVMLAMSLAQLLGTVAFALYGYVIVKDLRRARRERRLSQEIAIAKPTEGTQP